MSRFVEFLERLQSYAQQPCIESDSGSYTYAQLLSEFERWAIRFDELNVAPEGVVGMRADYSLASIAALLALIARRTTVALIPRHHDTSRYLRDAHAAAFLEICGDGSHNWHSIPHVMSHPFLEQLHASGGVGLVMFTSGSTGHPKAALQSVDRFLYKFRKPGFCFRTLAFLLFDHVGGLDTTFYTLSNGGTLILTLRRDPGAILNLIESHRVEVLPISPSFLRLLFVDRGYLERDLSSLKIITYGSEPMDSRTLARLNARFPGVQIKQKYGTTETGSPRSISRGNDSLWIRIGHDGVETRIIDGVLWIRSEGTMLGYLNAPSPVDELGWYCTGDLVDVDGEWIRFRGRSTDVLSVGGQKVSPVEIERVLLELGFVRDALVSGEPHALLGQVVIAKVALTMVAVDTREVVKRIRQHCRERLAPYKMPVKFDIVSEVLTNERQKMNRQFNAHDAERGK